MTLNTLVNLTGPIELDAAFDIALRALLTAADEMDRYPGALIERNPDWQSGYSYDYVGTKIGQGLPGITDAKRMSDGSDFQPERDEDDGEIWTDTQPWSVQLSWDTAYGYRGKSWRSASALHGAALTALHGALPDGITMRWQNEFTGEWFNGIDGLDEFMGEGEKAQAFATLATALIVANAREGSGS